MDRLDLVSRIILAIVAPWRVLLDGAYAARVKRLDQPDPEPKPALPSKKPELKTTEPERDLTAALQLLAILQREGRFVDFVHEELAGVSDADIGAAARVVHEGCRRALAQYVNVDPIREEAEGQAVQLAAGFDAARIKITGNVIGDPPFSGTLAHHGWVVSRIKLPKLSAGHDPNIVAPAEVEL